MFRGQAWEKLEVLELTKARVMTRWALWVLEGAAGRQKEAGLWEIGREGSK